MVELPEDLKDQFMLYNLADHKAADLERVRMMSVADALLWTHFTGYSAYLEQKHLKEMAKG